MANRCARVNNAGARRVQILVTDGRCFNTYLSAHGGQAAGREVWPTTGVMTRMVHLGIGSSVRCRTSAPMCRDISRFIKPTRTTMDYN